MDISVKLTSSGIKVSYGDGMTPPPNRSRTANQLKPKGYYVYAHVDSFGKIFYVGKGTNRRAWSKDRHRLWTRYVEPHLNGNYTVEILHDNLTSEEATLLEDEWMTYCESELVNWVNLLRDQDLDALTLINERRDANRWLIQRARALEKRDPEKAVEKYIEAIAAIPSYQTIKYERGLLGKLMDEEAEELGQFGEIEILDRLSMCLIELGRPKEAAEKADAYFIIYEGDLRRAATERIRKRIAKALKNPEGGKSSRAKDKAVKPRTRKPSRTESIEAIDQTPTLEADIELSAKQYKTNAKGIVDGKHYTEFVKYIKQLKKEQRYTELTPLLLAIIEANQKESKKEGGGVAPGYYEQLAIIYRKQKRYTDEVAILEIYDAQKKAPGVGPIKLAGRLVTARELAEPKAS